MRLTWAQPEDLLPHEFVQAAHEGRDIRPFVQEWVAAGGGVEPIASGASPTPASPERRELARRLLDEVGRTAPDPHLDVDQPSDWESIARLLADGRTAPAAGGRGRGIPEPAELRRRLHGAWLGRCCGCVTGKPVEKIPREGIREILLSAGRWPLDRYFTAVGVAPEVLARWPWNRRSAPTSLEENIDGMPEDDDLNYPLLALDLLEGRGAAFTTDDVAELWLASMPAGRCFTAERATYRNILDARPVPETATHVNPFREWIGAFIRGDVFGWVNPGDPLRAAQWAWRDARLSHVRNGIYGEMWTAALASASLVSGSAEEALDVAGQVLPPRSELAAAVRLGRELGTATAGGLDPWESSGPAIDRALDALHAAYGHLHWVHVLNNAATTAFALSAGRGDFRRSVALGVMAGWDTDSVGATIGSVVGALGGPEAVPGDLAGPIHGRLETTLPGGGVHRLSDLVDRTQRLAEALR